MLPKETQWNDAQIRFGAYNSKCKMPLNDADDVEELKQEEEEFGASGDLHLDQEQFSFVFPSPVKYSSQKDMRNLDSGIGDWTGGTATATEKIRIDLQGYQSKSNITYCSTGLTMWPAAENLCKHLISHPNLIQSKRILELGSGLGLCGLLAYHMTDDRTKVFMTDGDTDTLGYLRKNIKANIQKSQMGANSSKGKHLSCDQLLWSKENADIFLTEKADNESFDVILASDIIYAMCVVQPMWETVQTLLKPDGVFLFAFARRQVAVSINEVLEEGVKAGFEYEECEETSLEDNLFVYIFRWKH